MWAAKTSYLSLAIRKPRRSQSQCLLLVGAEFGILRVMNTETSLWAVMGGSHLAEIDVSEALSNAVFEIGLDDMPTNMSNTAFFRLASQDDSDGDGISDGVESWVLATNPGSADSDGDGLPDADEISLGTDPASSDSDGDNRAWNACAIVKGEKYVYFASWLGFRQKKEIRKENW